MRKHIHIQQIQFAQVFYMNVVCKITYCLLIELHTGVAFIVDRIENTPCFYATEISELGLL